MKYFTYIVMGIVAATIIAGFFVIGSPANQRLVRFDDRRISDLQVIQSRIINFWSNKGRLPESLNDLKDDLQGVVIPKDPETQGEYGYEVKGENKFILCATFRKSSKDSKGSTSAYWRSSPYVSENENWDHPVGLGCFERTIDKELYPPFLKPV